ncbi:MAG: hypothetical protein KGJ41_10090 [Rhodospirillales bacterium]|nr:hypothetical protein [Rhodospirillales bacterium]MDE2574049.1 hypothetical protein [Rhodospirillales bacterium]
MPDIAPYPARATSSQLNRVPDVTITFWIVKVMATTVGETAADFLNSTLNLGLSGTSVVMSGMLVLALSMQLRARRYVPSLYWLVVVLISVVGTLISDNLVDNLGVSLVTSTLLFGAALALVFTAWFSVERTLSVHTIFTVRREGFYWAAILCTFALGTSAGDLLAERLALGYALSAMLFAAVIGLTYWTYRLGANPILTFWIAYIVTRPLGASTGDLLSQPASAGGLALGTVGTSMLFLATILGLVIYMTGIQRRTAPSVLRAVED